LFSRFVSEKKIPSPQPVVSLPVFSPGDANKGLFRFLHSSTKFDQELWNKSVDDVLEGAPFATNMTFEDAIDAAKASVHASFVTGMWSRFAPETKTKGEALANPACVEEIRRRIVEQDFSPYTMALKDETIKPGKIPRTFLPVGLDVLVASYMVYGDWLLAFQRSSCNGINYAVKDFPSEIDATYREAFEPGRKVFSSDASGADTSIRSSHKRHVYEARDALISDGSYGSLDGVLDVPSFRRALREFLIEPIVHAPDGSYYIIQGNASGSLLTINDNSIIFRALHFYVIRRVPSCNKFEVYAWVTGDDSYVSLHKYDFTTYFDAYRFCSSELGFDIGSFQFRDSAEYCGYVPRYSRTHEIFVRVAAHDTAIFDALRYNRANSDYTTTCMIVQSLLSGYYWSPVCNVLRLFRAWLENDELSSSCPRFSWVSEPRMLESNIPQRGVMESSCPIAQSRCRPKNNSVLNLNDFLCFRTMSNAQIAKKAKKAKKPKPAAPRPAQRAPARMVMVKAASAYESRYSEYLKDSTINVGGPADGARYAEVRSLKVDDALAGGVAATKYELIFALDCLRPAIHKWLRDTTLAANLFVYQGDIDLSTVIALNDYDDVRLSSAQGVISSETINAGTNVVGGHFHAAQLGTVTDYAAITEDEIRAREVGVIHETQSADIPAASFFIPTDKSMVPRPLLSNATKPSSEDVVYVFDTVTAAADARGLSNAAVALNAAFVSLDIATRVETALGVHPLASRFFGPVSITGFMEGSAALSGYGVEVTRASVITGVAAITTLVYSDGVTAQGAPIAVRDDKAGFITKIRVINANAAANTLQVSKNILFVRFEGGALENADVMIWSAWGVSGAQTTRFQLSMGLDLSPGANRKLENPPRALMVTRTEAASAIREILSALPGKKQVQAAGFRSFLQKAGSFAKKASKNPLARQLLTAAVPGAGTAFEAADVLGL